MNDIDALSAATAALLQTRGYKLVSGLTDDPALPAAVIAHPAGLLPVLCRHAEELWRADTNALGFGLRLQPDPAAFAGFRLTGLFHAPPSIVVLAIDEMLRRLAADGPVIPVACLGQDGDAESANGGRNRMEKVG